MSKIEHVEQSDTELFNLDEIKNLKENDLKITSSEQEIKQLKAVLYDPENCLDESIQKEAERIFHQKNAERQENQQKEIEMDVENMSGDDEDPNAQTYQRRTYEELRGNFEAILFEYCKASVGEIEELRCRRLWFVVGNRERAPRF